MTESLYETLPLEVQGGGYMIGLSAGLVGILIILHYIFSTVFSG